jgi:hypothetical protein
MLATLDCYRLGIPRWLDRALQLPLQECRIPTKIPIAACGRGSAEDDRCACRPPPSPPLSGRSLPPPMCNAICSLHFAPRKAESPRPFRDAIPTIGQHPQRDLLGHWLLAGYLAHARETRAADRRRRRCAAGGSGRCPGGTSSTCHGPIVLASARRWQGRWLCMLAL